MPGINPWVALVVSAAAIFASNGLGTFWPAAWVAPVPILIYAVSASRRRAALLAGGAYWLGSLNVLFYLARVMPAPLVVVLLLMLAATFAAAVLATRFAMRRLPPALAAFAFPAAWVSFEFFSSLVSPHGTALSLAYSQTDVLPLMQLASVTGIWGVTFAVALVPAALAAAWTRRAWPALAPAALIVAGVFAFGAMRLQERPPGASVRVGLAASDRSIEAGFATKNPSVAVSVAQAYAGRIARLSAAGARVVILPEKFVGVTPADAPEVLAVFSDAARTAQVTVIAGINRIAITPARNAAVVYAPDGSLLTEYDKHHLVPGLERGYETGAAPALFEAPGGPWGVAICKDMDFPAWSRLYARRGALLMAVPAWDFVVDARLHSRMAVVRGIEHGFGIARTAQQGALTLSDAYGRILAETRTANAAEALLTADIYPGPGATFYTRFGDWFGWLNILALLALIAGALSRPALAAP